MQDSNHCQQFVDYLIELARKYNHWSYGPDLRQRMKTGAALADSFIPKEHPARKILGCIFSNQEQTYQLGLSGFKPELTAGGQDQEAYRHIAAAAAAVLEGLAPLVDLQNNMDRRQLAAESEAEKRLEREAELADNEAGRQVGEEIKNYLNEQITEQELRQRLSLILCA